MHRRAALGALLCSLISTVACVDNSADANIPLTRPPPARPKKDAGTTVVEKRPLPACAWPTQRLDGGGCTLASFEVLPEITPSNLSGGDYFGSAVGWDGEKWLVVACQELADAGNRLIGIRVLPDAGVEPPFTVAQAWCSSDLSPAIGFDGTQFLVAFNSYNSVLGNHVRGVRVLKNDTVVEADSNGFGLAKGGTIGPFGIAGAPGGGFLVAYDKFVAYERQNLFVAHVTSEGLVFGDLPVGTGPGDQLEGAVAPDGDGGFLVLWKDKQTPDWKDDSSIGSVHVSIDGAPQSAVAMLSSDAGTHERPVAALLDRGAFPAWLARADDPYWRYGVESADPIDGGVRVISAPLYHRETLTVAPTSGHGLLAWSAPGSDFNSQLRIGGLLVGPDGTPVPGTGGEWVQPRCSGCALREPRLSHGNDSTLLIWYRDSAYGQPPRTIEAALIPDP